jgi:hypothetical protein
MAVSVFALTFTTATSPAFPKVDKKWTSKFGVVIMPLD